MQKWLVLIVMGSVIGNLSFKNSSGFAKDLVCLGCHRHLEVISENIKKIGIKSETELIDYLKNQSPRSTLHRMVTTEDIRQALKEIKRMEKEKKNGTIENN